MTDTQTTDKLSAKQQRALAALLSEPSIRQAAISAAVPETTLFRWLRSPDFDSAYRQARRESVAQATARLQYASSAAVTVLCQLMARNSTHDSIKLNAAKTILELAIHAVEIDDLAARLAAVEAYLADTQS